MKKITALLFPVIIAVSGSACAVVTKPGASFPPDGSARPFIDTPTRFDANYTTASPVCQKNIKDPKTGAQLTLVRWVQGRGDYEVSVGQYGARANEFLRVDCDTYAPIGLVMKRST